MNGEPICDCRVCGETVYSGTEWVVLNRYLYAKDGRCGASEATGDDGEYAWSVPADEPSAEWDYTGVLLHWPNCAHAWIEAKMIELPMNWPEGEPQE